MRCVVGWAVLLLSGCFFKPPSPEGGPSDAGATGDSVTADGPDGAMAETDATVGCQTSFSDNFAALAGEFCGTWAMQKFDGAPQYERLGTLQIIFNGTAMEAAGCVGMLRAVNRVSVLADLSNASVPTLQAELQLTPEGGQPTRLRLYYDAGTSSTMLEMLDHMSFSLATISLTTSAANLQLEWLSDRIDGRYMVAGDMAWRPVSSDVYTSTATRSVVTLEARTDNVAGTVAFDNLLAEKCP